MKRLLLGSSLIMFVGFIAVFAAILYKINTYEADPSEAEFAGSIVVGPNAEVIQVMLEGDVLFVLVREGGKTALVRVDPVTGEQLSRTEFVAR